VPEYPSAGANSFQIELFFDGRIHLTYLAMTAQDGIVGLSAGAGLPSDFSEYDFAGASACENPRGIVMLDAQLYGCADTLAISVADDDLFGASSIPVTITSSYGDVEVVTLHESESMPARFFGSISTDSAAATHSDGVLQVDSGATIEALYADADDGTGQPAVATANALALCIDPFLLYQSRRATGAPRFYGFAPLTAVDPWREADFKVLKLDRVGAPSLFGSDPETYVREYRMRQERSTPRFTTIRDVRVQSRCGVRHVDLRRPEALLLPAAAAMGMAVSAPAVEDHSLENFLCYKAKDLRRLSDGTKVDKHPVRSQIELADAWGAAPRRYDLTKVTRLCAPAALSGDPVLTGGPERGSPKPIVASEVRVPAAHLVCYAARLSKKNIAQAGCAPIDPKDRGITIVPAQIAHPRRDGLHSADAFASTISSTTKAKEICLPALVD